jgi:DNA-directed RNA polymerase subunit beta
MKEHTNYITTLPDFIEMQRLSFSWFISQGLADELIKFSSILDFTGNIESLMFGQDYKLIKPFYTALDAKKYTKSYVAQLQLLIEIRDKTANIIFKKERISIVNLPLMTNSGTFIINGCERIVVSQIIRSPGIYFEKNKKQKSKKRNSVILSTKSNKLKPFITIPWSVLKSSGCFSKINNINRNFTKSYLIIDFLEPFRLYKIICKTSSVLNKLKRIEIFLNLLNYSRSFTNFLKQKLSKFKNLYHVTSDYLFLENFSYLKNFSLKSQQELLLFQIAFFQNYTISNDLISVKYLKLIKRINIQNSIIKLQTMISLKNNFIYFFKSYNRNLKQINQLQFLKRPTFIGTKQINNIFNIWNNYKNLKPTIFFAFAKKKFTYQDFYKSKTKHQIKDLYKEKYEIKDLYTAILVPEYGSWIRFGFHQQKEPNILKHVLKTKFDEDIIIQIDKVTKNSVVALLKEIGLNDLEISKNLHHSDFFYFNIPTVSNSKILKQPLIRFFNYEYYDLVSDSMKIFDSNYYRLGKIGRYKVNSRLNLKLLPHIETITYEDIFAIIDQLLTLSISKTPGDDIDHLKNRRVRSVGELLQNLIRIGFQRLSRKISSQVYKSDKKLNINLNTQLIILTFKEFFGASQLSQYMDQTNPLAALTHKRRISGLGPGGFDRDRISFAVRDIHPSHYGRICPIETPEGQNVGLIASLTTTARVNKLGFIETPFWRVINGKIIKTANPIYLTADLEDFYKVAPADITTDSRNYLKVNSLPVRYKQDFMTVRPFEVDFIAISNVQIVSAAASLIPFFEHDDANRALMGSNMQRQSVPLLLPQQAIVGTGLENQIAIDSGFAITSIYSGIISYVSAEKIVVNHSYNKTITYNLQKYHRSNQETCINHRPLVWVGEKVKSGQILADGPAIEGGELALGQNVLVAYMPWHGYNFEDAILINERLVYEDIFTSIHIEKYEIEISQTDEGLETITKNIPNVNSSDIQYLDDEGIISKGTFVKAGDILIGKITPKDDSEQLPEAKLLRAIFGAKAKDVRDSSLRMPNGEYGRVIDVEILRRKSKKIDSSELGQPEKVRIFLAQMRKIQVGDKIAGRHGNKGIISRILPRQDMPFLSDGTPIDVILNPLGVPSRMNVGQLYECLLGLAGQKLNRRFKILPFDEMYGQEVSRILINKKLRQASIENNQAWLFNPYSPGKIILFDGNTGKEFENPITVGNAYMLKLIHLVDDKIHARATGPYSLVTQQPLGGKAQHGGQRFGEMEVWALEGFGAAYTLQELLTIKSDDMQGRNDTLNAIVKGQTIPKSGIPESFKVLLQELRCIGLDISTYKLGNLNSKTNYDIEVNLMENYDPITKRFSPTASITNLPFY